MLPDIPEKYKEKLVDIIANDSDTVHFFQSIEDNTFISLSESFDAKDYRELPVLLRESGLIEKESLPVFDVFCERIDEGIINGCRENSLGTDLSIKLPGSDDFKMCHMYALFLRDENGRITDIHYNIRPYSPNEYFTRDVMKVFSSDKNPKIYSQRCRRTIDSNPDKQIAFIQFDVERFKMINEEYGVEKGDELLQFFNDSLALICRDDQPFCRLTADVYMIVTPFDTKDEIIGLIHKIESMLSGFGGMEYRLIFGVCIVEDRAAHTRKHGDNASLARQLIKGNAIENILFYDKSMKSKLHKKQQIEESMNNALLNGEFLMFLQPKYSISTGRIIGAEALARWNDPAVGMISPAEFIPVFEENGFILKLDCYIWEQACKKIRELMDLGIKPVPISVNISREYIKTFDIIGKIKELIGKYDIPISMLELEITETADTSGIEELVTQMKEAGFTMLMDDFGSGYSSLNILKSTPFDVLKIDRFFLEEFMDSDRGRKIIEHTISMSQDIGLGIIAEGVETGEQAEFLSRCGCDAAQGFYYSRPIPSDEFNQKLISVNK